MLKVALINPARNDKYAQPPMGLALLAAVLEREGYPVTVIDANALRLDLAAVGRLVAGADVAGITAMTPSIGIAVDTARYLKQMFPDISVFLGGAHATLLPEETLKAAPEIDVVVCGEGEETILSLLRAVERKQSLDGIAGISYRKDGEVITNPRNSAYVDMESLPFLAYHLLPVNVYRPHPPHGRAYPFAAVITSRGCPYRCSYCSKPIFGYKFRAQSAERVVAEVTHLVNRFGIKEIAFYDDVFTLNKQRAHDICEGILRSGLKFYWTCESRVNLVDRGLLSHLKQAGCYSIAYGIESASPEILKTLDKDTTLEQVEEAVSISREVGLQTIGYFMFGSPGESPETIRQTIDYARKLKLDFAQFAITTPFPGTKLYEMYLESSHGKSIPWESFVYAGGGSMVSPVFESSQLSRTDLNYWVGQAYREFYLRPSYVWQRLKQVRSIGDLKVNIQGLRMLLGSIKKDRC